MTSGHGFSAHLPFLRLTVTPELAPPEEPQPLDRVWVAGGSLEGWRVGQACPQPTELSSAGEAVICWVTGDPHAGLAATAARVASLAHSFPCFPVSLQSLGCPQTCCGVTSPGGTGRHRGFTLPQRTRSRSEVRHAVSFGSLVGGSSFGGCR